MTNEMKKNLTDIKVVIWCSYVFQLATNLLDFITVMHACYPGRHIAIDSRLLILSWNFCVQTGFHMRILKSYLSVCSYSEERNCPGFVNISLTEVIDTWMERSSRVLHHRNPEMWKFFKKFEIDEIEFCPYP